MWLDTFLSFLLDRKKGWLKKDLWLANWYFLPSIIGYNSWVQFTSVSIPFCAFHLMICIIMISFPFLSLKIDDKMMYDFLEDDHQDNQPFQTLEHILEAVDPRCGFNVEIKYPMQRLDGTWDGCFDKMSDLNEYVDIILKVLFNHAKDRNIIISCFHPDVCAMWVSFSLLASFAKSLIMRHESLTTVSLKAKIYLTDLL